jgi:hypothetical protein
MTAAVIALAVALVTALSLIGYLAHAALSARSAVGDERSAHVATRGELERTRFELEVTKSRLADVERMADALQEVLADVEVDHGLDPRDVAGRVRRAAAQAARDRAGQVPAGAPTEAVSAEAAAGSTEAAGVPADRDALMRRD